MDQSFQWVLNVCTIPTLHQGVLISAPLLISGITLRLCVLLRFSKQVIHALVTLMGLFLLWYFYSGGVVYFVVLCGLVYMVLLLIRKHKGVVVGAVSIAFLLIW